MSIVLDILSAVLVLGGAFFLIVGGVGLIRLPDFYSRLHAAGVTDTAGAELILFAMMLQAGFSWVTVKLILIGLFLFFTSPTSTHAVANAAYTAGLAPHDVDDGPGDAAADGPGVGPGVGPGGTEAGEGASSSS